MSENLRETYVRNFQEAMGQEIDINYNPKALYLRMNLIKEELNELQDEVEKSIFEFKENSGQINKETKQNSQSCTLHVFKQFTGTRFSGSHRRLLLETQ